MIDSPVLPDEVGALPDVLAQAGFPVSGLLATHADWDHLLGRLAFPDASLGVAASSHARLEAELGAAQRALRAFDDEHYLERGPLGLGGLQSLPVPGRLSIGSEGQELELHAAEGHTPDGVAYWVPWLSVLICGDYLSPVEIPMISEGGSVAAYVATLERLSTLVFSAQAVVPGHGAPVGSDTAKRLLTEDVAYLDGLLSGGDAALPNGRRSGRQRAIHAANLTAIGL